LQLPRQLYEEMLAQARAELPNECCGLLAGTPDGRVVRRYPLVNTAASPREYQAEGPDRFAAEQDMRRNGIDVLAVYHSHPTSEPIPSRTDLARNGFGTWAVHLIISLKGVEPLVRGWWLTETDYREAQWEMENT